MFKPVWDNIIVQDREPTKKTEGGLYLPDNASTDVLFADVVFVGPGPYVKNDTTCSAPCSVDDVVLIHKGSGMQFDVKGIKYRALPASHIIAVEDNNETK